MKLSLVTGAYERPNPLRRLVDSVLTRTHGEFELIISDASSVPFACDDPRVRVLHEVPRLGHAKGYNAAFRECHGEYILWLNDDAEVCDGYDSEALAFMEAHPEIGLGALHYSENNAPFHVNSAWGVLYANFGIFPRKLGERVGFFDERLTMYGADNSLAIRILLAGYGVADIPGARILHHSQKDRVRTENQSSRPRDNRILQERYMPRIKEWRAAYMRHHVDTGSIPWSHGVPPRAATA